MVSVSVAFAKGGNHFNKEQFLGKSWQTIHIRHGVARYNTECPVKFEFQIEMNFFSISMSPIFFLLNMATLARYGLKVHINVVVKAGS